MTLADIEREIEKEFKTLVDEYIAPMMEAEFVEGIKHTDKELLVVSLFDPDPLAEEFVESYKTPFFKELSDTTKTYLFGAIKETIEEGGTAYDLWAKIEGNRAFTPSRAGLIWRTEMSRAFNAGTDARARDLGVNWGYVECAPGACALCASDDHVEMPWNDLPTLPRHPNCFLDSQTPVYTSQGWKPIGKVIIGDLVLTHKKRFRNVTDVIRILHQTPSVVQFTFEDKEYKTLVVTSEHPVLVNDREGVTRWKAAGDCILGDSVKRLVINEFVDSGGEQRRLMKPYVFVGCPILAIEKWEVKQPCTLYNLSVGDDESYIAEGVVVHNCECVKMPMRKDLGE